MFPGTHGPDDSPWRLLQVQEGLEDAAPDLQTDGSLEGKRVARKNTWACAQEQGTQNGTLANGNMD